MTSKYNTTQQLLLYIGDTLMGDVNKYASNRHLSESLKSEQTIATSDEFTFDINWKVFQDFVSNRFDDDPISLLRVGKMRMVFVIDGRVRFAGWLASRPARSGNGSEQMLSLKFFEYFARLSGDVVCDPNDITSPMRVFTARPAQLYAQDLITEFMNRAAAAGESLNWDFGDTYTLGNKTITYKDFQTVSKALCDAMNNTQGAGKFDIVFRTDPQDFTHQYIDILSRRGADKNIIIKYPSDGVYALWSTDYSVEETNDYASDVIISGNGQVGDPAKGENTAQIGTASNPDFVSEYCYYRAYKTQSNLSSQSAVQGYADTLLSQLDFGLETPNISLEGRPIAWGDTNDMDAGLAIGDSFYFQDNSDGGTNMSGQMRIIAMDTDYNTTGTEIVKPVLKRM